MAKFNPFQSLSKEEQEKKEAAVIESLKRVQELKDAARACLKLEEFKAYQEKAKAADAALVNLAMKIDMFDPAQLWKLQSLQSELRAIRGMMTVERDAK